MLPRCCEACGQPLRPTADVIEVGALRIVRPLQRVTWRGKQVKLTRGQFNFVELLASRAGRIVAKDVFYTLDVIGQDTVANNVDVVACNIRKAFKRVDPEFAALRTIWGAGLVWDQPS